MQFKHEYLTSIGPDLFHYTDLAGLKGILENHDLWLTHSRFCNDDEEMTHGYSVAKVAIAELRNAGVVAGSYLDRIDAFLQEPEGVYICCFCEQDNLLSQWRNYAANGTGVSIQINTMWFSQLTGPDCKVGLLRFWKVYYDPLKQRGIVAEAINRFRPGDQQNFGQSDEQLARKAADAIAFFIPTFKNPDFHEENEWRLIYTPEPAGTATTLVPEPRFRVGRNMLTPYYGLQDLIKASQPPSPLPVIPTLLPILRIHIGPSPNKLLNAQSARMLLAQHGYPTETLKISAIPYRG